MPILFSAEDLRALYLRPGGTLTVTTTARYAPFSARLDAGLDPDRDASISLLARLPHTRDMHQLTFQLTDFNAVAHLAAHHHLHLYLQQERQPPLVLPAPHDKLTVAAQLHTYQQSLPT
ncbi:hypothetical protein MF271_24300 (plasmid) [Deinococcus sp. KNUC1210]|uniref:hypothetical protein n=1 Tax=Deinococcus sp. KNUC1210 TaxID=2917691 RepID=UPI001EEF9BF2|nr:hypothetical protein [Deinococcus sp. KNUC1210]ULH18082.1 hypothetical protein MF271_24300 [Deinococcus sp. KNUC1210]